MLAALPSPDPRDPAERQRFHALVREYPSRPGKVLRGKVVMLSAAAHQGDEAVALTTAAALELFQSWVLIHDDVEDGSRERRGLPTLHEMAGVPVAINVGDALHVHMWRLLGTLPRLGAPPGAAYPTVADTSASLGADTAAHPPADGAAPARADVSAIQREFESMILRTAEGQHVDLSWVEQDRFDVGEDDYVAMVTDKTAYYTVVSPLRLGAACAGVPPDAAFEAAGVDLGVAFQIRDDVLNLTRDVAYGKEFAGDLYEGKRTLILAHLFAAAKDRERRELERVLRLPREAKTAADIEAVLALMERHGSLDYAQAVALERAERGLTTLRAALARLPGAEPAEELLELLGSIALRRS